MLNLISPSKRLSGKQYFEPLLSKLISFLFNKTLDKLITFSFKIDVFFENFDFLHEKNYRVSEKKFPLL